MWKPNFDLMDWIRGKEIMVVNKAQEASPFNDLKIFILLGGIGVALLILLIIGWVVLRTCAPT
jgi:flagellar biogenesis protein FliO